MRKGSSSLPSTAAGFAGFFFLLCAISVVRPVRDQAGIAAGGTAGTLAGPSLVQWLARPLGPANLIPISALLLELSVQSASALRRTVAVPAAPAPPRSRIRDALGALLRPSLLRALSGYVLLFTATATLLYFEQARMVARTTADDRERTLLFARVDLAVNATTLALQAF